MDCQLHDVLLRDPARDRWLLFRRPVRILVANRVDEVLPVLRQMDHAVQDLGLHAAGWLAYESAPGLDRALEAKPADGFPLVWLGLYPQPEIIASIPPSQTGKSSPCFSSWTASISRERYDSAIANIKAYIAQGQTYQVNYTYRLASPFEGDPLACFFDLYRSQNAPYAAFVNTGRYSLCSASPELFFTLEGDLLTSKPMKGTAPRGRMLQEDRELCSWLRGSEKNQAENVMIVDMVRNDIGRIAAIGSVQVSGLYSVEKYPTVWQMVSTVSGRTGASLSEIFESLFPPASITGAPKARTMEIIAELETTPRRIYTGCIGFVSPGRRAQFNVAIRTVLIDHAASCAEYGVGGGITWDSTDSAEFEECRDKAKILSLRMPEFRLLETLLWEPSRGYFLLDHHLMRLAGSAEYFDFKVDLDSVRAGLARLAGAFGSEATRVRLLLDPDGRVDFQTGRLPPGGEDRRLRVGLAAVPVDSSYPFLYHKTTHRQVYEQAMQAGPHPLDGALEDVLLWNERGELTESCRANLVVELDGELCTPPIDCGLLPGTYRAWLLEQGKLKEKIVRLEDLKRASQIFLVNSVRGQQKACLFM